MLYGHNTAGQHAGGKMPAIMIQRDKMLVSCELGRMEIYQIIQENLIYRGNQCVFQHYVH